MPPDNKQVFLVRATVPQELANLYIQHLRDFDKRHAGCHLEIMLEDSGITLTEALELILRQPGLTFQEVILRKRQRQEPDN